MKDGSISCIHSRVVSLKKDENDVLGEIKQCGKDKDLCRARRIHSKLREQVRIHKNVYVSTALISAYAKCGAIQEAQRAFDELSERNAVAWNALINAYSHHGLADEAVRCLLQMREEGVAPDKVTYICVLKASSSGIRRLRLGQNLHVEISESGFLGEDILLGTALMNMWSKFGVLERAQEVFELLKLHDVASWTALIAGYARHGFAEKALECYREMRDEGIAPNSATFISLFRACGDMGCPRIGEEIHSDAERAGVVESSNAVLMTMLVDMHAKCGAMGRAREVFEQLWPRDVVAWSALISGYAHHGLGVEALECFQMMKDEGVAPNAITFSGVLKACGSVGSLEKGEEIYGEIRERGLLRSDVVLGNALIDMFIKCGRIEAARVAFEMLPDRDTVSWSSILAGYAQMGDSRGVLKAFDRMRSQGVAAPNSITFLALLSSCNHDGLVEEGVRVFDEALANPSFAPTIEHYTCMVDLFGRAGCFDRAIDLIGRVASSDRLPLLLALLGACSLWVNVCAGRWAFEQLMHLDRYCTTAYVSMRNIYATAGMHQEGSSIKACME